MIYRRVTDRVCMACKARFLLVLVLHSIRMRWITKEMKMQLKVLEG